MGVLAQAGNNPQAQDFTAWLFEVGGPPLVIGLFAALAGQFWFIWWFTRWHQRLSSASFTTCRNDVLRGVLAGLGFSALWLLADFAILWQKNAVFWNRQAWETRIVMLGMFLVLGSTVGSTVFRIRRFKKTCGKAAT